MTVLDKPSRHRFLPFIFGSLLGVSLGLVLISGILFFKSSRGVEAVDSAEPVYQQTANTGVTTNIDESRRNAIVVATERVAPTVVSVTAVRTRTVRGRPRLTRRRDSFWQFFSPEPVQRDYTSLGSGVIISPDGYVLSNHHVISNADRIDLTLSTGETVPAELVGTAPDYDIALLKMDKTDLSYANLGDSDDLYVGEWAIAIGQPFGQLLNDTQFTVTVGVISALHREVQSNPDDTQVYKDMIQTDAAINPGNSGGPLINARGEVVGINTAILSGGTGANIGIGFAIPINRGKWVLDEIRTYGRVRPVWVGLRVQDITPQYAAELGFTSRRGILIREMDDESPAQKAGLKPGDLIIAVNGHEVVATRQANRIIFGHRIGEELKFDVERQGKTRSFEVVLEEKTAEI